nr:transposase, mutator type [Tanacetum cinerariifolium]
MTLLREGKHKLVLSNISEVFNGQLLDGRDTPIISTIEYARKLEQVSALLNIMEGICMGLRVLGVRYVRSMCKTLLALADNGNSKATILKHGDKSTVTTSIPMKVGCNLGRPRKKRKKSAGENILMVNNGKLSSRSTTATCVLCKTKGHNKRSCKGSTSNVGNTRTRFGNAGELGRQLRKEERMTVVRRLVTKVVDVPYESRHD